MSAGAGTHPGDKARSSSGAWRGRDEGRKAANLAGGGLQPLPGRAPRGPVLRIKYMIVKE